MADNVTLPAASGKAASREVTYSGETAQAQAVGLVTFAGADDAKTAVDVSVDAPLPVGAQRVEDLLVMMARVVKLLESNAVVDQQQRQRITLDAIAGSLTLGTVTTVGTVTGVSTVSTVAAQTTLAGMDREMYINQARSAYALTIRSNLEFV
jgi:acetyl-CoA carboxylase carboxyltransferase component